MTASWLARGEGVSAVSRGDQTKISALGVPVQRSAEWPVSVRPPKRYARSARVSQTRAGLERAVGPSGGVMLVQRWVEGRYDQRSPWGQGPNPEEQPP